LYKHLETGGGWQDEVEEVWGSGSTGNAKLLTSLQGGHMATKKAVTKKKAPAKKKAAGGKKKK
jgi:hypothetical protein